MLESINCEPYGYSKYNPDDLDNIVINAVEDIKHSTEDIEIIELEKREVHTNLNIDYTKSTEAEQVTTTTVNTNKIN